jgi:hypothetical protein
MEASKWLTVQALLDIDEIEELFQILRNFKLYIIGSVIDINETEMPLEKFLNVYRSYVNALKEGIVPNELEYRPIFTSVVSASSDFIKSVPVNEGKQIIRVVKPVIQLQPHRLGYSVVEEKFRPMVKGKDSIAWGIQFSYPQLYQEGEEVIKVDASELFPNTALFHILQKWMRQKTIPTPFIVDGKKMNVPIRLGKNCFSWINRHPQLIEKNITVAVP